MHRRRRRHERSGQLRGRCGACARCQYSHERLELGQTLDLRLHVEHLPPSLRPRKLLEAITGGGTGAASSTIASVSPGSSLGEPMRSGRVGRHSEAASRAAGEFCPTTFTGGSVSPETGAMVAAVFNESLALLIPVGQKCSGAVVAGLTCRPRWPANLSIHGHAPSKHGPRGSLCSCGELHKLLKQARACSSLTPRCEQPTPTA